MGNLWSKEVGSTSSPRSRLLVVSPVFFAIVPPDFDCLFRQNGLIVSILVGHRINYRNTISSCRESGAEIMATGTGVNQGKTAFVEDFLSGHPDGSFASV